MAKRLLFSASIEQNTIIVKREEIDFEWVGGFAHTQKLKRLAKFRDKLPIDVREKHIEVSSGSDTDYGKKLSAFNLRYSKGDLKGYSVESVYQGSKVFKSGGPYQELYYRPSIVAKKDPRIKKNDPLISFQLWDEEWPLTPPTGFYNYLYFLALTQNPGLINEASKYEFFSDLEFNHERAISCQAESLSIFFALHRKGIADEILQDKSDFLTAIGSITIEKGYSLF